MSDYPIVYNLRGHSGCNIYLYENADNTFFVRKVSASIQYNDRLKKQAEKQANFINNNIKAPRVYRQNTDKDGLFYFDMEYIPGITLSKYIKTIEIGKIQPLVKNIVETIYVSNTDNSDCNTCFKEKLNGLSKSLNMESNQEITLSLKILTNHNWSFFNKSQCHGDLTLENIIIKDGQMYLIDFLDSFYDSWLLDAGTLLQDVLALWSYRNESDLDMNTIMRLMIFKDILIDNIYKKTGDRYIEIYYALLLKLMRVLPYTKDDFTKNFLINKIRILLRILPEGQIAL